MAIKSKQKLKLLYLAKLLYEKTDDEHFLTTKEIASLLCEYDIEVERKTLSDDIDRLREFGVDIICNKVGKNNCYNIGNRSFELAELKMMVDLIQSSRFITDKKSKALISKLEKLVSENEASQLDRQVFITGRLKAENEQIYYNVDLIHRAINEDHQVKFQYFQWDIEKEPRLKHDGAFYEVSPWALAWDNENYYLVGYDENQKAKHHYRVDKMVSISVSDRKRSKQDNGEMLDEATYSKRVFGMYGGKEEKVRFKVANSKVGIVIDRFGRDITIEKKNDETFEFEALVAVSDQFLGWVLSLGNDVKIIGPESVVDRMRGMIEERMMLYDS